MLQDDGKLIYKSSRVVLSPPPEFKYDFGACELIRKVAFSTTCRKKADIWTQQLHFPRSIHASKLYEIGEYMYEYDNYHTKAIEMLTSSPT